MTPHIVSSQRKNNSIDVMYPGLRPELCIYSSHVLIKYFFLGIFPRPRGPGNLVTL